MLCPKHNYSCLVYHTDGKCSEQENAVCTCYKNKPQGGAGGTVIIGNVKLPENIEVSGSSGIPTSKDTPLNWVPDGENMFNRPSKDNSVCPSWEERKVELISIKCLHCGRETPVIANGIFLTKEIKQSICPKPKKVKSKKKSVKKVLKNTKPILKKF